MLRAGAVTRVGPEHALGFTARSSPQHAKQALPMVVYVNGSQALGRSDGVQEADRRRRSLWLYARIRLGLGFDS
jgi:hypothetical protein